MPALDSPLWERALEFHGRWRDLNNLFVKMEFGKIDRMHETIHFPNFLGR
jgi:hypothetical protein